MEYDVYNYINGKKEKNTGDSEFDVYNPAFGKKIATVYDYWLRWIQYIWQPLWSQRNLHLISFYFRELH